MAETNIRTLFVTGLRNAHAMENEALSIMKPQLTRIENYPEIAARLERHTEETRGQIARIDEILTSLGEEHSTFKDMALSFAGGMAALSHSAAGDEIIKNSFANVAFEHFEIAAYKSLIALAGACNLPAITKPPQESLDQEVAMATWLDENIAPLTLRFAALKQAGETAKR